MKYLVNSNSKFAKHSLNVLIPSMINCGINPQDILVVIGGSDETYDDFKYAGLFYHLNVKFDAIDQTSFYAIRENPNLFKEEYYYYMHDTTKVGPKFKFMTESLLNFVKEKKLNTMKNTSFYSGNMGFYKKEFILKSLNESEYYIKNEKILLSMEETLETKKNISYELEDKIFYYDKQLSNGLFYTISNDKPENFPEREDIYGTGIKRGISYHQRIDLYKFGLNISTFKPGCKI